MANLPSERIDPSPPFTYSGMDVFGPFITRQGRCNTVRKYGKKEAGTREHLMTSIIK